MAHEYPNMPKPQATGGLYSNSLDNGLSAFAEATTPATLLGFRVGGWGFLLPIGLHCEVIEALPVNPLPRVEPWFSGLLNIRGNIVPVVDLCVLPGATVSPPKKRYLLALDRGGKTMALWIDGYPQMMTDMANPVSELPPLPQQLLACVRNAYRHQGQLWLSVQFDALFKSLGARQSTQETMP